MPIKLLKKAEEAFHEPCKLTRSWSVRSKTPSVLYHGVTLILTHQIRNFEMIYLSSLLVLYHGLTELQWQTPAAILIACAARGLDPRIRKHFSLFLGKVGQFKGSHDLTFSLIGTFCCLSKIPYNILYICENLIQRASAFVLELHQIYIPVLILKHKIFPF